MAKVTASINVISLVILFLTFTSMTYGPRLQGWAAPVTDMATLHEATHSPPPDYRHTWTATAWKNRDCDFRGLDWFLGSDVGRGPEVVAYFIDKPQERSTGLLEWDGLVIDLDPQQVLHNSHAFVDHTCRVLGIPVTVRTLFYSSNGG